MYTLCTSANWYRTTRCTEPQADAKAESWAMESWRGLVACGLFSVIFLPEFPHDGDAAGYFVYAKVAAGFRFIDFGILLLVLLHLIALTCSRRRTLFLPREIILPGMSFLLCIAVGIGYGRLNGGTNFFFDWRALALGIGLYVVWALWIGSDEGLQSMVRLFALYMTARIALLYTIYLTGHGETLLGMTIPTFDGPALSAIVFTALLAFRYQADCAPPRRFFWMTLASASYLVVLLCFRRTYWGELAIGSLILLLRQGHRIRNIVLAAALLSVVAVVLGRPFAARVQSLDVMQMDSEFGADNPDHLHDLQDAWDEVRQSPLLGIGVGTAYPTWRIRNWKNESVMVHNAPIHVWLKYGAAGLICYLWFHAALLRWLYVRSKYAVGNNAAFLYAAFAYLAAQFAVTLGFAPWPYSELQLTTLTSFILAAAFLCGWQSSPKFPVWKGLAA